MIKNVTFIVGLPGSGKTTYARSIMDDTYFLIDDPIRDKTLFDQAVKADKPNVIICDPLLIGKEPERIQNIIMERFGDNLDFEWIYFENNQRAAWFNHLKRNDDDPRHINEQWHKTMSDNYVIPENAKVIPVYKPEKE
jgi:adenylate kinase family enzyme